jgi:hypothetical protein
VAAFRDKLATAPEVGQQISATHVLGGSLRRAGNRLRINVQMVVTRTGHSVWAERYDREMKDVFEVQEDIARCIAQALRISLSPQEEQTITRKPTENLQAYDFFLRGRNYTRRQNREFALQMFEHELLRQARAEWEASPPEHQHLIADSDEAYLSKVADSIVVEQERFVAPRELTKVEQDKMDGELVFLRLFGDRASSDKTGNAALDGLVEQQEREAFEKLVAPVRRSESFLESLAREAFEKVLLEKRTYVPSEHDRSRFGIMPAVAARAVELDPTSNVSKFLMAYVEDDTATQRQIARELAAA